MSTSNSLAEKLSKWFFTGAMVILAASAVAKGIGASGDVGILSHPDPILGMFTNRETMLLAILLEVVIIGLVVDQREIVGKAGYIAWISTVFLAYHVGLWSIGYQGPCGCLGNVANTLGVSSGTADLVSGVLLAYLLMGSYAILVWKAVSRVCRRRGGWLANPG